jgi:hypothetical protein
MNMLRNAGITNHAATFRVPWSQTQNLDLRFSIVELAIDTASTE